jgi:membrane associated rhomboid family serine protease
MFRIAPVTLALIFFNVVFFLITWQHAGTFENPMWQRSLLYLGALFNPYVLDGEWYRVFFSMFLHGHIFHLLMNMIALYFVGRDVERSVGSIKFVAVYFVAGVGAAIASLHWSLFTMSVGASGAIFGIFGFSLVNSLVLGHREGQPLAPQIINFVIFILINVAVGAAFHADHVAHFGGLATGAIIATCSHFLHPSVKSLRSEYVIIICLIIVFFFLPRYQVTYYKFFSQVIRAEREGKAVVGSQLSDNQFLKRLEFNNLQWDSAAKMLSSHQYIPEKLRDDTATLSSYIHFREVENGYRIRMIRDEIYILMDSLEAVQDSISKYLQIEHPVPFIHQAESSEQAEVPERGKSAAGKLEKVWYDSNWVEIDRPGPYFRLGRRDSLQRWEGRVEDYYADAVIQMKGFYKEGKRDGIFLYYSHHNTYTSAGRYVENRSVGKWQSFHNNGRLKMEVVYGDRIFFRNIWDSAGNQLVKDGKGKVAEFYSAGNRKTEGEYINGAKEGIWMGWHANGHIHFKEEYRRGLLVVGRSRNSSGDEFTYDASSLLPVPKKGHDNLKTYLSGRISVSDFMDKGAVRISFRVTTAGKLTDFEIERSVNPVIDKEAIQILSEGPEWLPARLYGYQPVDGFAWVDVPVEPK